MFAHERPPIERAALQLSGVMRRLVPSLLGALAATAIVSAAGTPVSLREVRQSLFGTCFPTERDGWMVGDLGRIFHTGDGGTTWERQDAGTKRPFLAIACLDARTAWIAGKEGIVYGTTDGGASWIPATTGSTRHVFGLAFANPERGHGVGDYGTMIHTEDAGRHWTVSQVPPDVVLPESALDTGVDPGDVNLYAASYGDPDHLWVAGEFGTIMASDDGGRAGADRARRQLDPLGVDRTGGSWLRGRRRGPRLRHRRRRAPAPPGHGADEGPMIPKRWIAAYLRFLLRNRLAVSVVVAVMTVFFAAELPYIKVAPQFLDFYTRPRRLRAFGREYT